MTYLQLVNEVLNRLREPSVTAITDNTYSILVSKMVNDSKRQVEDAWNWDALSTTVSVNTSASTSNQVITGSGMRQKSVVVNCTTSGSQHKLINKPIQWILDQQDLATQTNAQPAYYAWNGNNGTDSKCEFFPTPDGTYALKFHMYVPQVALSVGSDTLTIPSEPVILGAFARALAERGEDGGLASSEAYALFKASLADHIAIEASRYIENSQWIAV